MQRPRVFLRAAADCELFEAYHLGGDGASRDELVARHRGLAEALAHRYRRRGLAPEDLSQVAVIGLLKAIDRFDPERGTAFSSFAVPTILGELRRHFRDHGWSVRVPRRLQELRLQADRAREQLTHELGRQPTWSQVAERCDADPDEVAMALDGLRSAFRPDSLEQAAADARAEGQDVAAEATTTVAVDQGLAHLSDQARRMVELRYWEGLTQQQIAERVGVSQMQVSRVLRWSLERMQDQLTSASSA